MNFQSRHSLLLSALLLLTVFVNTAFADTTPLPSWSEGPARQNILAFVAAVTDKSGPDFVPPAERIAVFDNDGTLWWESPV